MKTIAYILSVLATVLAFTSCSSSNSTSINNSENEAVIVAKINVLDKGRNVNFDSSVMFNEKIMGHYRVHLNREGYVTFRLPVGDNFLAVLQTPPFKKYFWSEYATFNIETSGIYYIGDITIDADYSQDDIINGGNFSDFDKANMRGDYNTLIIVSDNYESAVSWFNKNYSNTKEINKALMQIN